MAGRHVRLSIGNLGRRLAGLNAISSGAWEFEARWDTATARRLLEMGLQWVASRKAAAPHSRTMHRSLGRAWLDLAPLDSAIVHLTAALPDTSGATRWARVVTNALPIRRAAQSTGRVYLRA